MIKENVIKFAMVESIARERYNSKNRVTLGMIEHPSCLSNSSSMSKYVVSLAALVEVRKDFEINDRVLLVRNETDSVQIRHKVVYKDNNGYFYKLSGKKMHFSKNECELIGATVTAFKTYLNNNYSSYKEDFDLDW